MLHDCSTFISPLWHLLKLIKPCYTLVTLLLQLYYTMLHPCSTLITFILNHVTALHPCNTFLHPYYTMLHPYNTFATSFSNHVTPLWQFCCILIIPCYTLVTLLLHPCNTFAASLFHHVHCGILSVFDIVAFCPDTLYEPYLYHTMQATLKCNIRV